MPGPTPATRRARHRLLAVAVAAALSVALLLVGLPAAAQEGDDQEGDAQAPTEALALTTPVLSARRTPWLVQGAVADPALAEAVAGTIDRNPETWCLLVEERGRPVLTVNPDVPLAPASVQKLLVGTALLEVFGPDHTLRTTMTASAAPEGGVVQGDLHLVGGGDPLFTTPGYQSALDDPDQPSVDAGVLADALVAAGVTRITGSVVGDDSRYDDVRWVATWPTRYQSDPSIGPVSALNVNDGFTGYSTTPERPNPNRRAGDPPLLAAETLTTLLEARGVAVDGAPSAGRAPEGAVEVAALDSRPMRELVAEMVQDSDNNTAEMLVKELGLTRRGEGTTAGGLEVVLEVLRGLGLPTEGVTLLDASGLDPGNRVPCGLVMQVLDRAGRGSDLTAALAVAGQTGTLRERMEGGAAEGRVMAKTGTLNTVNALAGWADTPAGAVLQFVGIGNGTDPRGRDAADAFGESLMAYPAGPPLDQLVPRAPVAASDTTSTTTAAAS